jgi:hypothetical protein
MRGVLVHKAGPNSRLCISIENPFVKANTNNSPNKSTKNTGIPDIASTPKAGLRPIFADVLAVLRDDDKRSVNEMSRVTAMLLSHFPKHRPEPTHGDAASA